MVKQDKGTKAAMHPWAGTGGVLGLSVQEEVKIG
jgi:hypothetical protein